MAKVVGAVRIIIICNEQLTLQRLLLNCLMLPNCRKPSKLTALFFLHLLGAEIGTGTTG